MQRTIGVLVFLLAAQLILAAAMSFTGPSLKAQRPDTPLLDLHGQAVDRLTIEGSDHKQVVLARQGKEWVLPESDDFPADAAKVDALLERLKGLQRGLAVGATASAQRRFKVSDNDFERRLTLAANDKTLGTLYLGTSPGLRQVHARTAADDAVYTTGFAISDAALKPDDWLDKGTLKVPQEQIASIGLGELTLVRAPNKAAGGSDKQDKDKPTWTARGLDQGETLDQSSASALVQKLATLTFASLLGREAKPEYGLDKPVLTLQLQRADGQTTEYRFGKREAEKDYVLKLSSRPEYFRVPAYSADALLKAAGRDQLVSDAPQPVDEAASAGNPEDVMTTEQSNAPPAAPLEGETP
ncbi:MAG: DUF4340 domain-containing protein [Gammaproteobacteria bacterium]